MKKCTTCHELKPLDEFAKNNQVKSGLRTYCKPCAVAKAKAWDEANPDKARARETRRRLKKYGLDSVESLGEPRCGACGSEDNLCIDHDHSCCGKNKACIKCVRGWLCRNCNAALGLLGDSPERVTMLLNYVNRKAFVV